MSDEENIVDAQGPNAWSVACSMLFIVSVILFFIGGFIGMLFMLNLWGCGNWAVTTLVGIMLVVWGGLAFSALSILYNATT